MVPLDLLHRKSLFAFLHTLDIDLAEGTRAQGCPTVGAAASERLRAGATGRPRRSPRDVCGAPEPVLWPGRLPAAGPAALGALLGPARLLGRGGAGPHGTAGRPRRRAHRGAPAGALRGHPPDAQALAALLPRALPPDRDLVPPGGPPLAAGRRPDGGSRTSWAASSGRGAIPNRGLSPASWRCSRPGADRARRGRPRRGELARKRWALPPEPGRG
jgi:hypothetical protein